MALSVFTYLFVDKTIEQTDLPSVDPELSQLVLDRHDRLLRAYTVSDGIWRMPVSLNDVDPRYFTYLLNYEDKRFYEHNGVDYKAVIRAIFQTLINGEIISGASTITMQVARLLEPQKDNRWLAKLRQSRVALALERRLSKQHILELYIKLAPFGGNIEGIRAASLAYLQKEPLRLTAAEIGLLVALPQSPEKRRPDRQASQALNGRNHVLARLHSNGMLSKEEMIAAKSEAIVNDRVSFPSFAAHLADRVSQKFALQRSISVSIDRDLQSTLERYVRNKVSDYASGISLSVLVMDHKTGDVLSSIGSPDYLDHQRNGFVDMTQISRSPGSTLKPVIYALAFDNGIAHPETLINDSPTYFGSYAPKNFDNTYRGTVRVREALKLSLNVPAVALLQALGPAQLMSSLRKAGALPKLPTTAPPGLAVGLGGVGMSLTDLVTVYASIASGGESVSPNFLARKDLPRNNQQILSKISAWQVTQILKELPGPSVSETERLAYKTGTSYGNRDAWAIGFDGQHVVGIWIGRPDGGAIPGMLGASTAAPVLFDVFGRIKPRLSAHLPMPRGTMVATTSQLPLPLRYFSSDVMGVHGLQRKPNIVFPPDGARVDLQVESKQPFPLIAKVKFGKPPFTWIADGNPVAVAVYERETEIHPDGPGYMNLSVLDADGISENIRVLID